METDTDVDVLAPGERRHRPGRRWRVGAGVGACLATAVVTWGFLPTVAGGHGAPPSRAVSTPVASTHTPRPVHPFRVPGPGGKATYTAVGVVTVPAATTGPPPAISRDEVSALLSSRKLAPPDSVGGSPDSLSLVSYTSAQGDGSTTGPAVTAWAAEYDNVSQAISYPVTYSGPTRLVPGWTVMIFVDASTGRVIDSFSYT